MTSQAIPIERAASLRGNGSDLSDSTLDRARPLGPQIYAILRRRIVSGAVAPEEPIDERRIAAVLGVSRTPVREAVRRLADERFIDVVAQSSTRVAPLDPALLEESRLIRRTLEMESAAQAAPRMRDRHEHRLADCLQAQQRCVEEERFDDAILVDDEFHHAIASVSGLERLWRTIELEKAHVDRCRYRMLPRPGEAAKTLAQHRRLLEALQTGDAGRARRSMADHLDAAWKSTRRVLQLEQDHREKRDADDETADEEAAQ